MADDVFDKDLKAQDSKLATQIDFVGLTKSDDSSAEDIIIKQAADTVAALAKKCGITLDASASPKEICEAVDAYIKTSNPAFVRMMQRMEQA